MTKAQLIKELVGVAQRILASAGADVVDDGHWGRYTAGAYSNATASVRQQIDDILRAGGLSASQLTAERELERVQAKATPVVGVSRAIESAASEVGVSVSYLKATAAIESNLNPLAVNGSSRGLFQMQPAAWDTAQKRLKDLPPYDKGVWDPLQNARAAAALTRSNELSIRKLGYSGPITDAVRYLAHQQGPAGFVDLWMVAESLRDTPKYVTAQKMRANPPQDKKGVTTDPKAFFKRWMAVAEAKYA